MTRIDFYVHAQDKLRTACVLTAKAVAGGHRVFVLTADEAAASHLDRLLWTDPAIGFLPHCRAGHRLAAVTPAIVDYRAEPLPRGDVLLNLSGGCPEFFPGFRRLLEIVGQDPADIQQGRSRFRHYRGQGYAIETHELHRAAARS